MEKKKPYLMKTENNVTDIYVYGDITSSPSNDSDVSSFALSEEINNTESEEINIYINSYGGEVSEALAIYNALNRHNAKVTTYCDGFACSSASLIFMAGSERYMYEDSLLMLHNPWITVSGNASELRAEADALEKMSDVICNIYSKSNLDNDSLHAILDKETWLNANEAMQFGLCTGILQKQEGYQNSARKKVYDAVTDNVDYRMRLDDFMECADKVKDSLEMLNKIADMLKGYDLIRKEYETDQNEEIEVIEPEKTSAFDLLEKIFD